MKNITILIFCLIQNIGITQVNSIYNNTQQILKGPYLGQKPPSDTAELFAPGIISTNENEALFGIFNNGRYIIFDRTSDDFSDYENYPIYICQEIEGNWSDPTLTEKLGKPWYFNHPDPVNNEKIVYTWWLPLDEYGKIVNIDLWSVRFREGEWEKPTKLPYPVNTKCTDAWPSVTKHEILYFHSSREGGMGSADIYRSIPEEGEYKSVENLGSTINSKWLEHDPCLSSDGRFMVLSSSREGSLGKDDLFVAFLKENGEWSNPVNLGNNINSEASENRPYLTPDGKYLFYTSTRYGNLDIFWVDAKIIESYRHRKYK